MSGERPAEGEDLEHLVVDPVAAVVFDDFVRRHYGDVLALALAATGRRGVAEELVQEAFIAAYRSWARVSTLDEPVAWVRRVVLNHAASRFRRAYAEVRALRRLTARPGVHDDYSSAADNDELWNHVRALSKRQREVIYLTYVLDLSRLEVSRTLQCSEETVKTHLARARRQLAQVLGDEGRSNQ